MLRPCSSEIDDGLSLARQYGGRDGYKYCEGSVGCHLVQFGTFSVLILGSFFFLITCTSPQHDAIRLLAAVCSRPFLTPLSPPTNILQGKS